MNLPLDPHLLAAAVDADRTDLRAATARRRRAREADPARTRRPGRRPRRPGDDR